MKQGHLMQDIQSNSVTSLAVSVTCITTGTYIKTHAGSWDQDVYYYIYNTYNMYYYLSL